MIGDAFEVMNTLGRGFLESIYENAMRMAFRMQGYPLSPQ